MDYFKFSTSSSLSDYIDNQEEEKFGNYLHCISSLDELKTSEVNFVLFGIPTVSCSEHGLIHMDCTVESLLQNLLNIQNNQFNSPQNLIVLGEIDLKLYVADLNTKAISTEEKMTAFHSKLSNIISEITSEIQNTSKLPIMIGGNTTHTASAAHGIEKETDYVSNLLLLSSSDDFYFFKDTPESFPDLLALSQFEKCYIFGLHKNNIRQQNLDTIYNSKQLQVKFYEDLFHLTTLDKCVKFKNAMDFLNGKFSFQLNLNALQNKTSSSTSTFGFSNRDLRTFLKVIKTEDVSFFHLCGFEDLDPENLRYNLSYLISDFIRDKH